MKKALRRMWKRVFFSGAAVLLGWASPVLGLQDDRSRDASRPKNVLLFTIDSCRADRFGVYGNTPSPTPNIDAWAATGTVFERAFSTSAWTAPGLVSILSGLDPPVHGVNNRDRMGPSDLLTLNKIFKKRNFEAPNLNFFTFAPYYANLGVGKVDRRFFGRSEGQELVNWLSGRESGEPFFLWYHSTIVHQPYQPDKDRLPAPRVELMKRPGIKAAMTGAIVPRGSTEFQEGDRPLLERLYDAEMNRMDELFGKSLALLKEKGWLEDTLIILTADHGEELLDHGFVGHASTSLHARLYDEFIHIPLIVAWPAELPQGKRDGRLASQTDIFPTLLKLMEWDVPQHAQGHGLFSPPLQGRTLFLESVIAGNQTTKEREHLWVYGLRQEGVKYIEGEDGPELYDLEEDPQERRNLAPLREGDVEAYSARLKEWRERSQELAGKIFQSQPERHTSAKDGSCPVIHTPGQDETLKWDTHTGSLLFDWSGDLETGYLVEYDIGSGDYHIAGTHEVEGNHQLLGPFPPEIWATLKDWNPVRIRVSPKTQPRCWSEWRTFQF